jgi:hypothetical protein
LDRIANQLRNIDQTSGPKSKRDVYSNLVLFVTLVGQPAAELREPIEFTRELIMKHLKMAIVLVVLAIPLMGIAKGGSSFNGGSGRSSGSSFSRGFSSPGSTSRSVSPSNKTSFGSFGSSKSAAPPAPAAAPSGGKTSFGSFGSSRDAAAQATPSGQQSKSALTQSLDKNAAQANALKTLDARNSQKAQTNTAQTPGGMPLGGVPGGSQSPQAGQMGQPYPSQAPPPTVIYQNSGSSGNFTSGLLGFMLGSAMHSRDRSSYPMDNGSFGRPAGASGDPATGAGVPKESAGMSFLRIFLWLIVLAAIGGIIWYFVRRSRQNVAKKANYTL